MAVKISKLVNDIKGFREVAQLIAGPDPVLDCSTNRLPRPRTIQSTVRLSALASATG